MKRLALSAALLALLFAGCLWNTAQVSRISGQLAETLNRAEDAVAQGDWAAADGLTRQAMEQWQQSEGYLSLVLCHSHTDEVTTGFQEVLGFLQYRSTPEYDSANGALVAKVEHLAEVEALNWRNLL